MFGCFATNCCVLFIKLLVIVLHVNCCFFVLHFVPRMLQSCFFHQVGMLFVFGIRWICVFSMTKEDEFYIIKIVRKVDQDASIDPLKCSFFQFQKLKMCICNLCTLATCKMLIFCNLHAYKHKLHFGNFIFKCLFVGVSLPSMTFCM
jgi:hypothetical protein